MDIFNLVFSITVAKAVQLLTTGISVESLHSFAQTLWFHRAGCSEQCHKELHRKKKSPNRSHTKTREEWNPKVLSLSLWGWNSN